MAPRRRRPFLPTLPLGGPRLTGNQRLRVLAALRRCPAVSAFAFIIVFILSISSAARRGLHETRVYEARGAFRVERTSTWEGSVPGPDCGDSAEGLSQGPQPSQGPEPEVAGRPGCSRPRRQGKQNRRDGRPAT